MNRRTKQLGVVVGILAICAFVGWRPIVRWLYDNSVSAATQERTQSLVEGNPQLQPAWQKAMQDNVLTWPEAKAILEQGGEKVGADE